MDSEITMDLAQDEFELECPSSPEGSIFEGNNGALKQHISLPQPLSDTSNSDAEISVCDRLFSRWEAYQRLFTASSYDKFEADLQSSKAAWSKPLLSATILKEPEKQLKKLIEQLHKALSEFRAENKGQESLDLPVPIISLKKQIEEIVHQIDVIFEKNGMYTSDDSNGAADTPLPKLASKVSEKEVREDFIKLQESLQRKAGRLGIKHKEISRLALNKLYEKVCGEAQLQLNAAKSKHAAAAAEHDAAESTLRNVQSKIATNHSTLQSTVLKNKQEPTRGIAEQQKISVAKESLKTLTSKLDAAQSELMKQESYVYFLQKQLDEIENTREDTLKVHKAYEAQQEKQKKLETPFKRLMTIFFNPALSAYLGLLSLQSLFTKSVKSNWNRLV